MERYNVLDLFCGCGGMSWGLAKKGFNIVAGLDIWEIALKTYQYNHKNAKTLQLDVADADPIEVLKQIGQKPENIDVIIGGPPCQGFSKNTPASGRFLDDPRNQLYKAFLRFVKCIQPKVVILENVAEIYNAFDGVVRQEIVSTLEEWGYRVKVQKIDMSYYGIPQRRRRCFAHPREVRGLTMREAARIQSFSDDFHFLGSRTDQAGQIGNLKWLQRHNLQYHR